MLKPRPWRRHDVDTVRHARIDDFTLEPRTYLLEFQRVESWIPLDEIHLWVNSPLTATAREYLETRPVEKVWQVRHVGSTEICGLLVRYWGNNVRWPYASDYALPLTYRGDGRVMYWTSTWLIACTEQVQMTYGSLGKAKQILADMLANPYTRGALSLQDAEDLARLF